MKYKLIQNISFFLVTKLWLSQNANISSAARDLMLIPFIKDSRPEFIVKAFDQSEKILMKIKLKL